MQKNNFPDIFYIGTKSLPTNHPDIMPSEGIYAFSLNSSGKITSLGLAAEAKSPAFLAKHPTLDIFYCIADSENPQRKDGMVISFRRDPLTNRLQRINSLHTEGAGATHLSVHPHGKYLFTANFHSGTASCFTLNPDGSLGTLMNLITLHGHGPNKSRQSASHPHWIHADPTGKYILLCDLGADRIYSFHLNDTKSAWIPNENQPYATVSSGAGCRHGAFSDDGRYLFILNEISCTLDIFSFCSSSGILTNIHSAATLPSEFCGENKSAGICLHPSGKFLYLSHRGADIITTLSMTFPENFIPDSGLSISPVTHAKFFHSGGKFPRFILLNPSGRFLLVCNKKSHHVQIFHVDPNTGALTPTDHTSVPWPVGGVFAENFLS
ncbi:MAG: lactonase family protein [Planctomycetia bacterium]|nr:lactonase family protein [Planctomycetia bacterium]